METDGDQSQQGASANGSAASGASSRPSPMNSMSLYERQAVQALQALQRQPNAAQYFQQLMLQQQINNAQLHNLAAVQQATLAASRQSSPSSSTSSQSTSTTATAANVTTSGGASTRPIGQGTTATSTISQSVLLSGTAGGQGQMYLRVNRSLRAPISSQLIFMPGSTATAAVAVAQQQPQAHQQQEVTPASSSSSQSDNDQVQNLAMRGVSAPKGVGVKTEAPEKSDSAAYSLIQPTPQSPTKPTQPQPQLPHIKIPTYPQPSNLKAHHHHTSSNTSTTSSIPLSQLLLHGPRALTTVTTAATTTHILVPTSSAVSQAHGYPVGTATIKPGVNAQTLVVQPLQKASLGAADKSAHHGNGPIPIQPKTLQCHSVSQRRAGDSSETCLPVTSSGLRLPLQLPSRNPPPILPAPPPPSSISNSGGGGGGGSSQAPPPQQQQQPHIPVQIVGARQSSLGVNGQALALAQARIDAAGGAAGGVPVSTAYSSVLSSSSSLLTMVASIASREAAASAAGRGAGLKGLQEALPLSSAQVSHVHPQANQNAAGSQGQQNGTLGSSHTSSSSQSPAVTAPPAPPTSSLSRASLTLPLVVVVEEQRGGASAVANGESVTSQGKQMTGSLKRKLESNSANSEDGPTPPQLQPIRDHPSVLSANAIEAGPGVASPSPSLSPGLAVARVGGGHTERAPPPQAVVKPHVLTHLIEGFVIQEGAEPFPVCGPVKEPTGEDLTDSPDTNQSESVTPATVLKCEYCKKLAPAGQFRGTKRFCSMTCAKRYNVSCSQHFRMRQSQGHGQGQEQSQGHHHHHHHHHLSASDEEGGGGGGGVVRRRVPRRTSSEIASAKIAGRPIPVKCRSESSHSDEASSGEEEEDDPMSFSPASSMASCHHQPPPPPVLSEGSAPSFLPSSPAQWSVEEVSQFISSLQGCEEMASQFLSQEIDGQALLLLKEEHLMSTMNIKLGPALKICAHINSLRD